MVRRCFPTSKPSTRTSIGIPSCRCRRSARRRSPRTGSSARLRGHPRGRRDRRGRRAAQRRRADGDAARRHGRAARGGGTGLPYASTVKAIDDDGDEVGVAHACGHDLHVTWLMGAARILSERRDRLARHGDGRVPAGRRGRARRAEPWWTTGGGALSEARRHPRPARDGRPGGHRRLSVRASCCRPATA